MKKKMVLLISSILIVALAILIVVKTNEHKSIHISKEITINANKTDVFNMVKNLSNYPKWSPFLAQDPSQVYEVKGEDGKVGAQYHWEGNKGKDLGFQEIISIDREAHIGMKCFISKPFESYPTFDYSFASTANGTSVHQNFALESDLGNAFFLWIFGVKSKMEETNEMGLSLLKDAIEG